MELLWTLRRVFPKNDFNVVNDELCVDGRGIRVDWNGVIETYNSFEGDKKAIGWWTTDNIELMRSYFHLLKKNRKK